MPTRLAVQPTEQSSINWTGAAMTHPARILVVDAEPFLADLLCRSFRPLGHVALAATSAKAALQMLQSQEFELVVVDLLLPDMDGFELVAHIRRKCAVPIMVLSALARPDDIVRALDLGADGYICKPVIFTEVIAKVQALLRRIYLLNRAERRPVLIRGDLRLDCQQRTLTIGNRTVKLSATESRLVQYLLVRPNRVAQKEELLRHVWGYVPNGQDGYDQNNVVELAIGRLRRKIEETPACPRRLVTVRSVGYQLRVSIPPSDGYEEASLPVIQPAQRSGGLDSSFLPKHLDRLVAA